MYYIYTHVYIHIYLYICIYTVLLPVTCWNQVISNILWEQKCCWEISDNLSLDGHLCSGEDTWDAFIPYWRARLNPSSSASNSVSSSWGLREAGAHGSRTGVPATSLGELGCFSDPYLWLLQASGEWTSEWAISALSLTLGLSKKASKKDCRAGAMKVDAPGVGPCWWTWCCVGRALP